MTAVVDALGRLLGDMAAAALLAVLYLACLTAYLLVLVGVAWLASFL